ncbi:MAG: MMPL family transporter [Flavobacteriales bacterium]|nr:MMPL family transporter [Flavobacteriales bacterium]
MNYKVASWISLTVIILITALAISQLPKIDFDYDFESYFPKDDSDIEFFKEHRKKYKSDNDFILFIIKNNQSIFQQSFLNEVKAFEDELNNLELVHFTKSPVTAKRYIKSPFGFSMVPYFHLDQPNRYQQDSIFIYENSELPGTLISTDANSLVVYIQHEPYLSKVKSDSLLTEIQEVISNHTFHSIKMAGRIHGQHYFIKRLRSETILYISISFVLVVVFLGLFFRSLWGVIVPIAVVVVSVIWLMALMILTGKKIDVLANLIPSIIFIVGMSDVVHIISKYLEELRNKTPKIKALRIVLKEVGTATFLTSLTTAVGFLSLLFINIKPIQEFALYIAAGVIISYILAFSMLPSILLLGPEPKRIGKEIKTNIWNSTLQKTLKWTLGNYKKIPVVFVVILILCIWSLFHIEQDNYLFEDLSNDDPIKAPYVQVDNDFGGSRPIEIAFSVKKSNCLEQNVLKQLQSLDHEFEKKFKSKSYLSPFKSFNELSKIKYGKEILSLDQKEQKRFSKFINKNFEKFQLNKLINKELNEGRLSGRIPDYGGQFMRKAYDELLSKCQRNELSIKITGTAFLIDITNETLVNDVIKGLVIAILIVSIILGLIYKSLKMIVISILPNLFPLIAVGAIMALANIDLKISTSIVFTIAFGIAVDDTIHFMTKLKLELNKGKSLLYAIKRCYLSTGKAIVLTSVILGGGFISLIFSNFNSIYYIGLLIGLALLMAVLADLVLLPCLLMLFYGKNR